MLKPPSERLLEKKTVIQPGGIYPAKLVSKNHNAGLGLKFSRVYNLATKNYCGPDAQRNPTWQCRFKNAI